MEIYITGDLHGDLRRFQPGIFYEQESLTKEDIVLVAGDFGCVWYGDERDDEGLDWLEDRPFTTAFVTGNHENYDALRKYSLEDWRGGATLPLHFEPVPVDLHVDKDKLDREFEAMTDGAGLTKDEKNELSRRVNMKAIMYNPARIRKVCEHIAKHFREKIEPNGYKGQVVVYDRECCLMYKEVLDELLGEEASTIVMDTNLYSTII